MYGKVCFANESSEVGRVVVGGLACCRIPLVLGVDPDVVIVRKVVGVMPSCGIIIPVRMFPVSDRSSLSVRTSSDSDGSLG